MTTITVPTKVGDITVELTLIESGEWTNGGKAYAFTIDGTQFGEVENIREESTRDWRGKWQGGAHWSAEAVYGKKLMGKFHKCDKCIAAGEIICTTTNRVRTDIHTTRKNAIAVMARDYVSAVLTGKL